MAKHELDQLIVTNPTDQYFAVRWNGVDYGLQPKQRIIWMRFLAEHYAKHLTNAILMRMEKAHKDAYLAKGGDESKYIPKSYMNSRELRPKTIESILLGVYQYHQGGSTDPNTMIQQQIDQLNPGQKPAKELDLGEMNDPLYGVMKPTKPQDMPDAVNPVPPQPTEAPTPQPGASMIPDNDTSQPVAPVDSGNQPPEAPTDLDGQSMKQLKEEAARLDITIPFGATKDDVRKLIRSQYA